MPYRSAGDCRWLGYTLTCKQGSPVASSEELQLVLPKALLEFHQTYPDVADVSISNRNAAACD